MPQGDKSAYTGKQKRQAQHIEDSYKERGVSSDEAEARAWATVNKESGGGKLSGSGRKRSSSQTTSRTENKRSSSSDSEKRSEAARKGWQTRRERASA